MRGTSGLPADFRQEFIRFAVEQKVLTGGVMHAMVQADKPFVLVGSAFAHHDLNCELKSRTHCTSCVFSQGSAGVA